MRGIKLVVLKVEGSKGQASVFKESRQIRSRNDDTVIDRGEATRQWQCEQELVWMWLPHSYPLQLRRLHCGAESDVIDGCHVRWHDILDENYMTSHTI